MSPISAKTSVREPFIDLLRFFAATCVVFVHANPLGYLGWLSSVPIFSYFASEGGIGVDVFFIISGYVIFMSAKSKSSVKFILARFIRLYPSMFLIVTLIFIYLKITHESTVNTSTFLKTLTLTFKLSPNTAIVPQLWTLVYEVKFYAAVAILLLISVRLINQANLFLLLILSYEILLFIFTYVTVDGHSTSQQSLARYQSFHLGHFGYLFLIGCCLCIVKDSKSKLTIVGAVLSIFIAVVSLYNLHIYDSGAAIVLSLSSLVILFPKRSYKSKRFLYISYALGGISYPLYLIHYHLTLFMLHKTLGLPIPQPLLFLIAYAITVLISFIIFRYYEVPVQRYLKGKLGLSLNLRAKSTISSAA